MRYGTAVRLVVEGGAVETNRRTGVRVVSVPHVVVDVAIRDGLRLPLPCLRRVRPAFSAAEAAWMVSGERSTEWLRGHTTMWEQFANPDGEVEAAYGHRWRRRWGDQLAGAVAALRADPTCRQVVLQAWDPEDDRPDLGRPKRNVPCPISVVLSPVAGALSALVTMRSSDVVVGLPYDLMTHALVLDMVAASVGMRPDLVTLALAHAHAYEPHWAVARGMVAAGEDGGSMLLPGWDVGAVEVDPDGYVAEVARLALEATGRPTFAAQLRAVP